MTPPRRRDWQERFAALVSQRMVAPFAWGVNDCCTFAGDVVHAITGADVLAPDLRAHRTEREALRSLQNHGDIIALTTERLGEPVPPAYATTGDIVLVQVNGRDALAACNGAGGLMPGPNGLVAIAETLLCWKVGRHG
jgi:hypothetical protein